MIKLVNIYKSFEGNPVLRGLNLEIERGKTTTIIGGSGSGKSVLFKHIIGLMKPDSGEVYIDNQEITRMKENDLYKVVRRFAMVFQGGALFDSMTVGENVAFGIQTEQKLPGDRVREIVSECLAKVGLPGIEHQYPAELSGGMKKRVAIARAVAKNPEIIMYDEPTTGIDPIMADVINRLILIVGQTPGITSVAITHDMSSAYKISDQIAVLFDGRIIEQGTPEEIRHTENPIVRQFIEGKAEGPVQVR